ncbi:acyl-CoA synthetase [Streptacidiphilus fuscans]|uniref:Acyl-CoA synthetase n=1 Tax=Streptacidiphilus fuscans TaxID=2789292 RepID=A0A931BD85_9ACTN|nr:acyl-CoA synthetase [Streptacidiphilus fuscans]MBF9072083.1 acyl-CoA synthetase [Streptacidiphilus fuscans]
MSSLVPALATGGSRRALRFGERSLSYAELAATAGALAPRLAGVGRVALWATPSLETAVGVVAGLLAGVPVVPVNPRIGEKELTHVLGDSTPELVLAAPGAELPGPLAGLPRVDVPDHPTGATGPAAPLPEEPDDEATALVIYTSGTTGPPKGALISRRAIRTTLDALAEAWAWTGDDVLVHALPLFHVHGLVLGILGPLRRGGSVHHLGRFEAETVAAELAGEGTMLFGVPTMYHRLAEAVGGTQAGDGDGESAAALAASLGKARLLVSGSAALSRRDHEALLAATGRQVIERYGMTETLMNTSMVPGGACTPGTVGVPLPGVELRLVEDDGTPLPAGSDVVGEIQVRGANLFSGYLNRPEATAAAFAEDGWFRTGDMAVLEPDGSVRIVGRRSTDLIKSGGYKIGAGEIETVLLDHPGVADAAVTGEPDEDLGERIIAWIVPVDPAAPPTADVLTAHVAGHLAPHKRPREVRFVAALPRNDMGKIIKRALVPEK